MATHTDRDPGWTERPEPVPVEDHQPKPTVDPGPWPYPACEQEPNA